MRPFPIIVGSLAVAAALGIGVSHNVDTVPTAADAAAMQAIMGHEADLITEGRPHDFQAEIELILTVQDAVLDAAPVDEGLPFGSTREPADLVAAGHGLCYDRSRAIEKLLRLAGMETRHVAVYSTAEAGSALAALTTPQVPSHAVSEVRTQRGWLLVDSNGRWISLTADGDPLAIDMV